MDFDSRVHVFRSPAFHGVIHEAVEFFDSSPTVELPPPTRFNGVGVYGLYFRGKYKLYAPVATQNHKRCAQPI